MERITIRVMCTAGGCGQSAGLVYRGEGTPTPAWYGSANDTFRKDGWVKIGKMWWCKAHAGKYGK